SIHVPPLFSHIKHRRCKKMERKKYYINIGSQQIAQTSFENTDTFTIYANDDELRLLRAKMDNMDGANVSSFFRAHVPIRAYHHDQPNDDYDEQLTDAFQTIYELGDEETNQLIDQIGVLGDRPLYPLRNKMVTILFLFQKAFN